MNVRSLKQPTPTSDWSEVSGLQQKLIEIVQRIDRMAGDVGAAKQIIEYDSDRRKRALSRAMAAPLAGGASAASAEAEGRASEAYRKELEQLGKEFQAASQIVTEWEAARLMWESARSLLSMQREGMKQL